MRYETLLRAIRNLMTDFDRGLIEDRVRPVLKQAYELMDESALNIVHDSLPARLRCSDSFATGSLEKKRGILLNAMTHYMLSGD